MDGGTDDEIPPLTPEIPNLSQETINHLFQELEGPDYRLESFDSPETTAHLFDTPCINDDITLAIPESQDSFLGIPTTSYNSYSGLQTMPPAQSVSTPQELTSYGSQVPIICSSSALPANANFAGSVNFGISFPPPEKTTKNAAWTFSEIKQKWFVRMGVNCPINFHTSIPPPVGTKVVVTAVYLKASHSLTPVQRCLNHQNPSEPYNHDHPALDHLIRCESHEGVYSTNETTGQKVLTLPYTNPEEGTDYSTYLYKFMCWSSCAGGMNRRQIKVIFTLQHQGRCLGQRSFEVRVCACPGRDRRIEEKECNQMEGGENRNCHHNNNYDSEPRLVTDLKRGLTSLKTFAERPPPPPAKKKKTNDSNVKYTLTCEDADEYEFLSAVMRAYRMQRSNGRNVPKKESSEEE